MSALKDLCDRVEVLSRRPYVPPFLSLVPRWKVRVVPMSYELRDGISIYRPTYLHIPWLGPFWNDQGACLWCRRTARNMHRRVEFDAIISFDLVGAGGIAWRIGRDLGIPAIGWATGGDIRLSAKFPSYKRVLVEALEHLDIVFYQSRELLEKASGFLGFSASELARDRHIVLARGIPSPPLMDRSEVRKQIREQWRVTNDNMVVLYVGSIEREKGTFELLEAMSLVAEQDPGIICILLGSVPARDETKAVQSKLNRTRALKNRVRLLPACSPDKVWQYLCAADIFAFPSHDEGMPNSLLEAMAMGIPAVAFAIAPVREIEAGTGALALVPPLSPVLLSQAILRLTACPEDRIRIGEMGKAQVLDRFMVRKNMAEALRLVGEVVKRRNSDGTVSHAGEVDGYGF